MLRSRRSLNRYFRLSAVLVPALAISLSSTLAQSTYQVAEQEVVDTAATAANESAGPVRLARFSIVQGNVTWRASESMDWGAATINLPIKQGAEISVPAGGRAEIQFDDGSYLRLGSGATAGIQELFSDADGEFTEIKLTGGVSMLQATNDKSVYQVDTPFVKVATGGPSRVRIGVAAVVDVGVTNGKATVVGETSKAEVNSGEYLAVRKDTTEYSVVDLPGADDWENWNRTQGEEEATAAEQLAAHNVPDSIQHVAGDLDTYGTWHEDPKYGQVWCPKVADPTWRPYYKGRWVWVEPFGWTWCSDEPWGWAPYHYGTWYRSSFGWAWRPGPQTQYWSPAVVHFTECADGTVAWCALAPEDVHYPAFLNLGFRHGSWGAYFSIGQAGCYYPVRGVYCVGRAFNTVVINRTRFVSVGGASHGLGGGFAQNRNTRLVGQQFVPRNARQSAGVIRGTTSAFGGRGSFVAEPSGAHAAGLFSNGHAVAAPPRGAMAVAGPAAIRPTVTSMLPGRAFSASAGRMGRDTPTIIGGSNAHGAPNSGHPQIGSTSNTPKSGSGGQKQTAGGSGITTTTGASAAYEARKALSGGTLGFGSSSSSNLGGGTPSTTVGKPNPNTGGRETSGRNASSGTNNNAGGYNANGGTTRSTNPNTGGRETGGSKTSSRTNPNTGGREANGGNAISGTNPNTGGRGITGGTSGGGSTPRANPGSRPTGGTPRNSGGSGSSSSGKSSSKDSGGSKNDKKGKN